MGKAFTADWIGDTLEACAKYGLRVNNVYSGHGTYATCGLSHYDGRVTRRFLDQWMKAQVDTAAAFGAGFGFFAHGFEELLSHDDALYVKKPDALYDPLSELAAYAKARRVDYVGIEQMYSPHQPPWRIADAEELMGEVFRRSGAPFYITADLGHMNGQQYFQKPDPAYVEQAVLAAREGTPIKRLWLGTEKAHGLYRRSAAGEMPVAAAVDAIVDIFQS
jgi:sugar phosphate isomerase/epimerase